MISFFHSAFPPITLATKDPSVTLGCSLNVIKIPSVGATTSSSVAPIKGFCTIPMISPFFTGSFNRL